MELLIELGVDWTLLPQFIIFFVAYLFMTNLLFKPYLNAYHKRIEATFGNQEQAEKINENAKELHVEYEKKARQVNTRIQSYFEQAQKEAQLYQAQTIEQAKKEAEKILLDNRQKIDSQVLKTKKDLEEQIGDISTEITKKIINRAHA